MLESVTNVRYCHYGWAVGAKPALLAPGRNTAVSDGANTALATQWNDLWDGDLGLAEQGWISGIRTVLRTCSSPVRNRACSCRT